MPIYSYACCDCGKEFQTLVRGGETPECPKCASTKLDQQLSLIASPAKGGEADAGACPPEMRAGCACAGSCAH